METRWVDWMLCIPTWLQRLHAAELRKKRFAKQLEWHIVAFITKWTALRRSHGTKLVKFSKSSSQMSVKTSYLFQENLWTERRNKNNVYHKYSLDLRRCNWSCACCNMVLYRLLDNLEEIVAVKSGSCNFRDNRRASFKILNVMSQKQRSNSSGAVWYSGFPLSYSNMHKKAW